MIISEKDFFVVLGVNQNFFKMKRIFRPIVLMLVLALAFTSCKKTVKKEVQLEDTYVADNYNKQEVDIGMRDGVKLHTTIYSPKDISKEYPILMQRTPYSSRPYGEGNFRKQIGPNNHLMKEGNIIVYQDVRGKVVERRAL